MAVKHFVVINLSDEIVCYINAPTIDSAIEILMGEYPEDYLCYDMYQTELVFGIPRLERNENVIPETEDW